MIDTELRGGHGERERGVERDVRRYVGGGLACLTIVLYDVILWAIGRPSCRERV